MQLQRQPLLVLRRANFFIILVLCTLLRSQIGLCQESYFSLYPDWRSGLREWTASVALGDVDGDGDLDLVCGNNSQNSTLYLNTGGTFENSPSWFSGPAEQTFSVALGDVDGDGDLDLVCGNFGQSNRLYRNTGGTFEISPSWSSGPAVYTTSVALGDVDGDGDLDLVCGNQDQSNTLYVNTEGTFETSPSWSSGPAVYTESVALGDVDGDGNLDLLCGNKDVSTTLYLNHGVTFETLPSWSSGPMDKTSSVVLGDVDGDGDLDLLCGNWRQKSTLYLNTGVIFETLPSWSSGPTDATKSLALGDVDGDSDLDLLCGIEEASNTLFLNNDGSLETSPSWSSGPAETASSLALGDVDGDGDLDLVCGNQGQGNTLYLNARGAFRTSPTWTSESANVTLSVALGDVDGDGDPDLACGNQNQSNTLYLNTGVTFEISPSWSSGPSENTFSVALGDVDGDNGLDLVCGNHGQSNTLYLNAGGMFEAWPSWVSVLAEPTWGIALGDVDGDGDLDLVCGNERQNNTLYSNTGGTFETRPSWSSGPAEDTTDLALGDVDGDSDLDLVCGNQNQGNTLYLNMDGTLESSPSWSSEQLEHTQGLGLGDADGDGDLDLVCGNDAWGNTLYFNTGGTFENRPRWMSGSTSPTFSVALGDVDGDGDLDLVCGNWGRETLHLNAGGTFDAAPAWSSGPADATTSVALGDVDGDGDLDLVCGNFGGNTLYVGKAAPVFDGDPLFPTNHLPNNAAHLRFVTAAKTSPEYYRVSFTAVDVESDPIWLVAEYQHEGDPTWHSGIIDGRPARVGPFTTSPAGVRDSIEWDTHLLPFDPREVILRLRVTEVPKRVSFIQHVAPYLESVGVVMPHRPVISMADELSFPSVTLGDTTLANVHVANQGNVTLTIMNVELSTPDMRLEDTLPVQIAPRESAEFTILLAPSTDADIQESIVIHSDDPFSPSKVVSLTAHVRPLEFTLANLYPNGEIPQGAALGVSVTMQDSVQVDSARVFYREGGQTAFSVMRLQRIEDPVNEQYFGSISYSSITERGIEYSVEVYNDRFPRTGELRRLRTRVENLKLTSTPPAQSYGMISLPLDMDGPILGVLSDDLGGIDIAQWRLWGYEGEAAGYAELPNDTTTDFEVGRGYWFVTRNAPPIDTGPAEGLSTPTDAPYEIVMRPGYAIVGNPFAFPVAWSACEVDTLTMSEAEEQGVVEPLWRWVPATRRYEQGVTVLEPFEGYWVMNKTDPPREIVLHVHPVEAGAGFVAAGGTGEGKNEDSGAWEMSIRVTCGDAGASHNVLGVGSDARETCDPHDRSEPPMSPGRSVSLYFPHYCWERRAGRYAVDVRGTDLTQRAAVTAPSTAGTEDDRGHTWLFDVAKNFSGEAAGDEVILEFSGIGAIPQDVEVLLVDRTLERTVDVRKENHYVFYQGERAYVTQDDDARFMLLVGSDEYVAEHQHELPSVPTQTVLHQNHPNPFNPSTIIRYGLATAGRVTLHVYDVSGALVRVLENRDRPAGRYEVGWDGDNEHGEHVSSGVYFYRLTAGDKTLTKKMVLLK